MMKVNLDKFFCAELALESTSSHIYSLLLVIICKCLHTHKNGASVTDVGDTTLMPKIDELTSGEKSENWR